VAHVFRAVPPYQVPEVKVLEDSLVFTQSVQERAKKPKKSKKSKKPEKPEPEKEPKLASYVLLMAGNVVKGIAEWDGTTAYNPAGVVSKVLLPGNAPAMRPGDVYNPVTNIVTPRPNTAEEAKIANATTIQDTIKAAITQIDAIVTACANFQAKPNYSTATVADLNNLLAATKLIANGLSVIAVDVKGIARLISNQLEATS